MQIESKRRSLKIDYFVDDLYAQVVMFVEKHQVKMCTMVHLNQKKYRFLRSQQMSIYSVYVRDNIALVQYSETERKRKIQLAVDTPVNESYIDSIIITSILPIKKVYKTRVCL